MSIFPDYMDDPYFFLDYLYISARQLTTPVYNSGYVACM